MNKKIAFVIDKIELRYFEMNELVTSFWLIKECIARGNEVFITTIDKIYLNNNKAEAFFHKTKLSNSGDISYEKNSHRIEVEEFNIVIFRPDPPVDIDYINSTYILDFVDKRKTAIINSPAGIRKANEKLYINNFPFAVPENITTSKTSLIKAFVNEHDKVILKPLNKCFGKGVFYLQKGDKNLNSILETATNNETCVVMVQKYIENPGEDKRVLLLGGKYLDEAIIKVSGEGDFKFNTHRDEFFKKSFITDAEKEICDKISSKLLEDGLYMVGLDMINGKIIEVNVTSPCFFIKEINSMYNVKIEKRIVDYILDFQFMDSSLSKFNLEP